VDCQVHMDGLGLSKVLVSICSAIFYCGGRDGVSRFFFFLLDFWPVCGSYAVILRGFPQLSGAIVCHDVAVVQGPFDDRDVS
jgi:hypothetical protein